MNFIHKKIGFLLLFFQIVIVANTVIACDADYPTTPQDVVASYLKEDFTRGGKYWERISKYTTWQDGPGWDTTILISGYNIKNIYSNTIDAQVRVEYQDTVEYSYDELGPFLGKTSKKETVTFTLKHTEGCWKIETPQLPPHLNMRYVIDDLKASISKTKSHSQSKQIQTLRDLESLNSK